MKKKASKNVPASIEDLRAMAARMRKEAAKREKTKAAISRSQPLPLFRGVPDMEKMNLDFQAMQAFRRYRQPSPARLAITAAILGALRPDSETDELIWQAWKIHVRAAAFLDYRERKAEDSRHEIKSANEQEEREIMDGKWWQTQSWVETSYNGERHLVEIEWLNQMSREDGEHALSVKKALKWAMPTLKDRKKRETHFDKFRQDPKFKSRLENEGMAGIALNWRLHNWQIVPFGRLFDEYWQKARVRKKQHLDDDIPF